LSIRVYQAAVVCLKIVLALKGTDPLEDAAIEATPGHFLNHCPASTAWIRSSGRLMLSSNSTRFIKYGI
jgi:hypothetical protein